MCKFKIDGICPDPLFSEKNESKITAVGTAGKFHFPLIIPKTKGIVMGIRQPSLIFVIENKGSVPVGMKMVLKATGTLTNPSITNVYTQEFFKINKTMQAGEQIVIDTIIGEKTIKGTLHNIESNYFKYRDFDSTWLQLNIGTNLFRYNADTNIGNLEVFIYYNNKYLEVQE